VQQQGEADAGAVVTESELWTAQHDKTCHSGVVTGASTVQTSSRQVCQTAERRGECAISAFSHSLYDHPCPRQFSRLIFSQQPHVGPSAVSKWVDV